MNSINRWRIGLITVTILFLMANLTYAGGIISLPQTGQTRCYDSSGTEIPCAGTGQDGEIQAGVDWPVPRFGVSGDCVTDNLTGLMWARNGNLFGKRTWQGALESVDSINSGDGLCGFNDWRLPNVNEFESLANANEATVNPWLNRQGFINVQQFCYWSGTAYAGHSDFGWVVYVWDGNVSAYNKSGQYHVWPVRSGQVNNPDYQYPANVWKTGQTAVYAAGDDGDLQMGVSWPAQRFIDHGDGTVTDRLTGLMWAKDANLPIGTVMWQQGLDYIAGINNGAGLGAYRDWRLPNKKELFSLIDRSSYDPALPGGHPFENTQSSPYWSSSTLVWNTAANAWYVDMLDGFVLSDYKPSSNYIWPVRSGGISGIISMGPGKCWIGLKNSDDQGTQFDLRTELYINDILISEGETLCVTGVTRNPSYAKEVAVPFSSISNGAYDSGDELSLRVLTRIGTNPDGSKCSGPGGSHNNAVGLRLYYDAPTRPSGFGSEIAPDPLKDFYLDSLSGNYFLNDTPPTGIVKYKDSTSINYNNGNPWKEIGTWSMTLP